MENKEKKSFEQAECAVLSVQEDLITASIGGGGSSSPIDPVGGNTSNP
jgi:hypothetical protein